MSPPTMQCTTGVAVGAAVGVGVAVGVLVAITVGGGGMVFVGGGETY